MGHAASGIGLERARERRLVLLPREGVVVRHREVDLLLRRGVARHLEMDVAQLGTGRGIVGVDRNEGCARHCGGDGFGECGALFHVGAPGGEMKSTLCKERQQK
jgi:hypothetical protein